MKNFFTTFFACLAAIVASSIVLSVISLLMFAGMIAALSVSPETAVVQSNTVLKIDLNDPVRDEPVQNPLSGFNPYTMKMTTHLALLDVLNAIEAAADDDRIKGIYLNLNPVLETGMANLEEIRAALETFKESGKFVVSYADFYTQSTYYLSSVADEVYLNPEGEIMWQGMSSQIMFFKGALDKLGVEAEVVRCGEFKSAVEPFISDRMSPANRHQMDVLLGTIWGSVVGDIARSREIDSALLQRYASDLAVAGAESAAEYRMIDGIKYGDEVMDRLEELSGEDDPGFIGLADYMGAGFGHQGHGRKKLSKNRIAVVYAEGDIIDGESMPGSIGGQTLADKLADVREDDGVKAVVLRVNSPGGSALASEVIWREMTLLQQEKPVVVSMGNYAASGGYYISCPADVILADRTTLTGSIGVFGLMFNAEKGLKDKLGITVDVAKTNPSADMLTLFRPQTPAEKAYLQNRVNSVYSTFVGHVAHGRNLPEEEVLRIGGGRVWSGISADSIGLIDGFGGLREAILLAADRAGVGEDFRVVAPSEETNPLAMFLKGLLSGEMEGVSSGLPQEAAHAAEEYRETMKVLNRQGVQALMPYRIRIQ